jgi:hypothetical protein
MDFASDIKQENDLILEVSEKLLEHLRQFGTSRVGHYTNILLVLRAGCKNKATYRGRKNAGFTFRTVMFLI